VAGSGVAEVGTVLAFELQTPLQVHGGAEAGKRRAPKGGAQAVAGVTERGLAREHARVDVARGRGAEARLAAPAAQLREVLAGRIRGHVGTSASPASDAALSINADVAHPEAPQESDRLRHVRPVLHGLDDADPNRDVRSQGALQAGDSSTPAAGTHGDCVVHVGRLGVEGGGDAGAVVPRCIRTSARCSTMLARRTLA
jgi:hypothetical protein